MEDNQPPPRGISDRVRAGRAALSAAAPKIAAAAPKIAAAAPKVAAKIPLKVSWRSEPPQTGEFVPIDPRRGQIEPYVQGQPYQEVLPYEHAQLEPVAPAPLPAPVVPPYFSPEPKPPWNRLSIVAFLLAFLMPVVGFISGLVAASQIKKTGERGAVLATLGWILGLANAISGAFILILIAVYYGIQDGIKGAIESMFLALLTWLFG